MEENHLQTNIAQYALIIKNKKMLVLWPADKGPLWVLPGGRLNKDDSDYKEALRRETREEIGQDVKIIEPFAVDMWSVNGKNHRYAVFFICKLLENKIQLSKDHFKYEWLGYEKLMETLIKEPQRARPGIELLKKLKDKEIL